MKYKKPTIVAVVQASASIAKTQEKEGAGFDGILEVTNPGYEADE